MAKIVSARAFANNEVAYLAWSLDEPIPGCLGFDITRIYPDTGEEKPLAAWVPFEGQANPAMAPQSTRVWPVQKLSWRDLTLRKRRDRLSLRPDEVTVQYRIRAVGRFRPGLDAVPAEPNAPHYDGQPVPLGYLEPGVLTNTVRVTQHYGDIRATFTNGILSAQWLRKALKEKGEELTAKTIAAHISTPGDEIRHYLTGDVLSLLKELLLRTKTEPGSRLKMALYELWDEELIELIAARKESIDLILSNTSKDGKTGGWDHGNHLMRELLGDLMGHSKLDRMFNNGHIGHNKFVVFEDAAGTPKAVLTGSTNWTPTGLAGQSNNALLIENEAVAKAYHDYWNDLYADTAELAVPDPLTASTSNVQGQTLRKVNAKARVETTLADGTSVTLWRAPNTHAKTKGHEAPPDLAEVYDLIAKAKHAVFFAVFLPSQSGKTSVIEEAIRIGVTRTDMLVYGAISDVMAMPNYVPPDRKDPTHARHEQPAIYENGEVHVVRAVALNKDDVVGAFESELLTIGKAIIHDKIVVIDPLSPDCVVITGSHNLGFKASYENDENLLIIKGNRKLAEAYMTHVLDVYDHYRFRALQRTLKNSGSSVEGAILKTDDTWLGKKLSHGKTALTDYLSEKDAASAEVSAPPASARQA
jgi:phosphatidylserine/phosphatidylglycerophosphate/cardiolipin synthase-like enzyme